MTFWEISGFFANAMTPTTSCYVEVLQQIQENSQTIKNKLLKISESQNLQIWENVFSNNSEVLGFANVDTLTF